MCLSKIIPRGEITSEMGEWHCPIPHFKSQPVLNMGQYRLQPRPSKTRATKQQFNGSLLKREYFGPFSWSGSFKFNRFL